MVSRGRRVARQAPAPESLGLRRSPVVHGRVHVLCCCWRAREGGSETPAHGFAQHFAVDFLGRRPRHAVTLAPPARRTL